MKWYEKIKESARGVIKVHPVSICVFFVFCILSGIKGDFGSDIRNGVPANVLQFVYLFTLWMTPVFVLCESNFAYKKKIGKIESLKELSNFLVYIIATVVGAIVSGIYAYIHSFRFQEVRRSGSSLYSFNEYFERILYVYLAICVLGALFFMYKRYGESFEKYALRAFLGTMKAGLVYGIILLGTFCILFVFGALFFDLDIQSILLWLVTGIVGFPATLMALSMPGNKTTRFSDIVMGYVFPGILAAAFIIVYAYIIKILITWTFPSNQVFSIATGLFAAGIAFWTMAQGCTEGKVYSALKIMPLLFIPFIVIQIMCLSMRIGQYGVTNSRYLGILLIIFEIIYEVYYIFRFLRKEGLGGILMPLLLLFVTVYYIVPGINAFAVITSSQKAVVEEFLNARLSGEDTDSRQLSKARSAYRQIMDNGGFEGDRYLKKLYATSSKEEIEDILDTKTYTSDDYSSEGTHYVYTGVKRGAVDIEGYSRYCYMEANLFNTANTLAVPVSNNSDDIGVFLELDISSIVSKLKELEIAGDNDQAMQEIIKYPVATTDGVFYIEYINFNFEETDGINEVKDLSIEGFYLYN
ncbi:MAG: DUF4153 domain-containing protein [Butyrivibrio sp.]|nr:DUF4153 domain-containing protein [Butyrivibrio sp.]